MSAYPEGARLMQSDDPVKGGESRRFLTRRRARRYASRTDAQRNIETFRHEVVRIGLFRWSAVPMQNYLVFDDDAPDS